MNSSAARINGGNTGGRCYSNLLDTILPDVFSVCCFTRTGFSCKKNIAVAFVYQAFCKLKYFITIINGHRVNL